MNRRADTEVHTEREIVDRAVAGDVRAYEELVGIYYGSVCAVAVGYVRCRETAEELAQEVFLRAYFRLSTLKSTALFGAWLLRMTRNLAVDWHRSARRASALVQLVPLDGETLEVADVRRTPAPELIASREDRCCVQQAVFSLPQDQRELILLHYAEELSKSEIARRLNVHPSSVGRRLGTALCALRVQLDHSLRLGLHSLRSSRRGGARAAALVLAASLLPDAARASVAAHAYSSSPGWLMKWLFKMQVFFSAAVRVRTLLAGAEKMITPFRVAALSAAVVTVASLLYLKPVDALADTGTSAPVEKSITSVSSTAKSIITGGEKSPELSGNVKTEPRTVEPFKSVKVAGSPTVKIQMGAPVAGVSVTADDQLLSYVETTVEGGVLEIRMRCAMSEGSEVNVAVNAIELRDVSVTGSGKAEVADLAATDFVAEISGSGEILARGSADSLSARVAGSGSIRMSEVISKNVTAKITGSGRIEINAQSSLDAKVTGSGVIEYLGSPVKLEKRETGSGRVVHKE